MLDTTMPPVEFVPTDFKKCQLVQQGICPDTFDDSELPTDVHIIKYSVGGEMCFDVIRAYTKVDIFDMYYDKLGKEGTIHQITSGYGKIRPNLYGKIKTDEES